MLHECNLHCHAMDPNQLDMLNIEDQGKWLPFTFDMDMVIGCKMTNDDVDDKLYNCTTIFSDSADSFIIDTPYKKFLKVYKEHHNQDASTPEADLNF